MLPHGFPLVLDVLRLHGQVQGAVLPVDGGDLHLNLLPSLQDGPGIFHPLLGKLGGAKHPFHFLGQLDDGLLLRDFHHRAGDNGAAVVDGHVVIEGVVLKLLDA